MRIVTPEAAKTKELTKEPLMTGGTVEARFLITSDIAKEVGMGIVKFAPGARTKFHTHTGEQLLYCLEGKGIVATKTEQINVGPGTVVYFPPGEIHWHGASKDSSFAHISIAIPHKTEIKE